jgi:hypothetical protein
MINPLSVKMSFANSLEFTKESALKEGAQQTHVTKPGWIKSPCGDPTYMPGLKAHCRANVRGLKRKGKTLDNILPRLRLG